MRDTETVPYRCEECGYEFHLPDLEKLIYSVKIDCPNCDGSTRASKAVR